MNKFFPIPMKRNIAIAYALSFLRNTWFWLGIWVFYYLKFTNYAGIGLIETTLIIATTVTEVPTGVVADFFGKKKTLCISFFLQATGMLFLAITPQLGIVIVAICIAGIGGSFYSGTLEALVYDSLKELGEEKTYAKIVSNVNTIGLIAPAVCGIIGGFLYVVKPNIPFFLSFLCYLAGFGLSFLLIEPKMKDVVVSFENGIAQVKKGMRVLFTERKLKNQMYLLVAIGAISVICLQMLNDFLGVEFGFSPTGLAILWSVLYILCAFSSQTTLFLKKYATYESLVIIAGIIIGVSLVFSPFVGILIGGVTLAIRACAQAIFINVSSIVINENVESQYRVTTLSSFNLLQNIPYVVTAFFIGFLSDHFSAMKIAGLLGVLLLAFIIYQVYSAKNNGLFTQFLKKTLRR